ncbi:hypothetical protein E4T42_09767 [Aureobasidium subglaciale]|nr:hypothetical protein E4T42_09767 [Aureobasidium subglaciale]
MRWIIEGLPVVALFPQIGRKQLVPLGQISSHNNNTDALKLWIGAGDEPDELLISLTLRTNVGSDRRKRKNARSQSLLMFLVVSILDLSFTLEAARSYVIMMEEPIGHSLQPQPLTLIRRFKRFPGSSIQSSVNNVQAMLQIASLAMKTPEFDLQGIYAGNRRGAINVWTGQGWTPDDEEVDPAADHNAVCSSPPAAYMPRSSPHGASTAQNKTLCTGPCDRLFPSRAHTPSPSAQQILSSNYTADLLIGLSTYSTTRNADFGGFKSVTNAYTRGTNRTIAQTLSPVSQRSCAKERNAIGPSSSSLIIDTPTRKRRFQSTRWSVDESDAKRSTPASNASLSPEGYMHYRGMVFQAVTMQSPTEADVVSLPSLYSPKPQSISNMSAMPPLLDASLPTTFAASPVSYHETMILWLIRAWELRPYVHYTFIAELLRLGDAAHKNDADNFHDCLVACTVALAHHCARERLHTAQPYASCLITEGVAYKTLCSLTWWLYTLDTRAELNPLPDLARFTALQQKSIGPPHMHGAEYRDLVSACTWLRASIISGACVKLGHRVLDQSEKALCDIALRMSEEESRSSSDAHEVNFCEA